MTTEDWRPWVSRIRQTLLPWRRVLSVLALPLLLIPLGNPLFDWKLFGPYDREARGIALLFGLLFHVFVMPNDSELKQLRAERRGKQ